MTRRLQWNSCFFLCLLCLFFQIHKSRAETPSGTVCEENRQCAQSNRQAIKLYEAKQYQAALEQFRKAYSIVPSANLLLNIGRTLHFLGQYEEALAHYGKYKETTPAIAQDKQEAVERFIAQANAAFSKALVINRYLEHRTKALRQIDAGRYQEALRSIQKAWDNIPTAELFVYNGHALQGLGLFPEAISSYERFVQKSPGLSSELAPKIKEYIEASDKALNIERGIFHDIPIPQPTDAKEELNLFGLCKNDAICTHQLARLFQASTPSQGHEDYTQLIHLFGQAARVMESPFLQLALGRALHRQGHLDAAIQRYMQYRELIRQVPGIGQVDDELRRQEVVLSCLPRAQAEAKRRKALERQGILPRPQSVIATSTGMEDAAIFEAPPMAPWPAQPQPQQQLISELAALDSEHFGPGQQALQSTAAAAGKEPPQSKSKIWIPIAIATAAAAAAIGGGIYAGYVAKQQNTGSGASSGAYLVEWK